MLVAGAGELAHHGAVLHEHEAGPQAHLERASQRPPGSVLHLDVLHLRVRGQVARHLGCERAAVAAPVCAELDEHGPGHRVHVVPRRRLVGRDVRRGHGRSWSYSIAARAAWACSGVRRAAAAFVSAGTHRGYASRLAACAPVGVCSDHDFASCSRSNRDASFTSAGHSRRCTYVTLPATRRQTSTSPESITASASAKIRCAAACAHQLPRMGSPATNAAKLGTGPRPDCSTIPCSFTNARAFATSRAVTLGGAGRGFFTSATPGAGRTRRPPRARRSPPGP